MAITQAQQDWLNTLQAIGDREAYNTFANLYGLNNPAQNPQMPPAGIDFNNLPGTSTVNPLSGFIDVTRLPGVDDNESISGTSNLTPPIAVASGAKPQIQDTGTTYFASNQQVAQSAAAPAGLTVADLYAGLLGRTPDAAGLAYWNSVFGSTIEPNEIEQFRIAAAPEAARQRQASYAQELTAANVQRVQPSQAAASAILAAPVGPSISDQLAQIDGLLATPQTGRGDASSETYALNQQVLTLDRFRTALRDAYNNPQLLPQIATQIAESNLDADNQKRANQFLADAQARISANPNALTGRYINSEARQIDEALGGLLGVNQANIFALDYSFPELQEAVAVYNASSGRITPEDALRAARQFDSEDSLNIGKSFNTSQNSKGQEGLLGGSYGFAQAIERYNPETNRFEGVGAKPEKDVFAAQFNANIGIGRQVQSTEGLSSVGEGFFTKKLGNPGAYDLFEVYYQDPDSGKITQVGTSTNFNPELSGFKKFISSPLGKIIIGVGAGLLTPGLSGFLATGTWGGLAGAGATLGSSLAAGGLLGVGSAAITGGNIGLGALTGSFGAGVSFGIGQAGGLGNVIARGGFLTNPKIIATLNKFVSGFGGTAAGLSDEAAEALLQSQYDDLAAAIGRNAADEVFYGAATGTGLSQGTQAVIAEAGDNAGVVVTATDLSTASNAANIAASSAATTAVTNAATNTAPTVDVNAPRPPTPPPITPPIVPIDVAPPVDVRATTPPPPAPSPTPPPVVVPELAPPVDVVERPTAPDRPGGVPAPIIDLSRPVVNTPDTTIGQDIRNIGTILGAYTPYLFTAASLLPGITPQTSTPDPNLPAWVYDPAQSRALQFINQIPSMQYPYFAPNFSNMFQRGGLGAGQYLGYDVLNRRGDIPAQTLLGVPTLAVNNIGVPIGQANTGATSLV
jgi:hypothetical protein